MAHCLKAIIGNDEIIVNLAKDWINAEKTGLAQGFSLIKLTDNLLDDINKLVNNKSEDPYQEFYYLSSSLHEILISKSVDTALAYVETDYFGGCGTQVALLYENGIVKTEPLKTEDGWNSESQEYFQTPNGTRAINSILKEMGVICLDKLDEFDSIRLSLHRKI